ncbi:MAG: hypothetical protein ACI8YQ_004648, partial [Polaribacter sp.]
MKILKLLCSKKALLFWALILSASFASTQTILIGSADNTEMVPEKSNHDYSYTQQLYLKNEINTVGLITAIRFYYYGDDGDASSASLSNSNQWVVYMGHTTQTSLSFTFISTSSMTQVFSETLPAEPAAGWVTLTLNTPFHYNNIDNLVIAVDENKSGNNGMDNDWIGSSANIGRQAQAYGSSNIDPASPPSANIVFYGFPWTELVFGTPPSCVTSYISPVNNAELCNGTNPVTLSWQAASGATNYDVYLSPDQLIDNNDLIGNSATTSFTTGNLTPSTYYWFILAKNASGSAQECTVTSQFITLALPTVSLNILGGEDEYCIDDPTALIVFAGSPTGGVYSGTGVINLGDGLSFTFAPGLAGVGVHTVTYTYTDANGCAGTATDNITVNPLPIVTASSTNSICMANNGTASASATGGTAAYTYAWSNGDLGANIMDLADGTYTVTATDANGCVGTASTVVGLDDTNPAVSFTAPGDLCINVGVQAGLSGGLPVPVPGEAGVYSGTGVTDDGNGLTYSFDPAAAGVGVYTLSYMYTDQFGCTNSATDDVEVLDLPVVAFTANAPPLCIADPSLVLGGGTPIGGVYSGLGVTDDVNGTTFTFDPAASAPGGGDIPVTYTYTDANGCTNSAIDNISVNPICCLLMVT